MYRLLLFRLDGTYVKEFDDLLEAVEAFYEVEAEPDPKRISILLAGPDTWMLSYK